MARAAKAASTENQRLDANAWIDAALELLAEQGIDNVRVEPLAKRLSVTKGSFYWHFKDRDALLEAMLGHWRRRATFEVIERIENTHEDARARLSKLLRIPFHGERASRGADVELSIRLWGRRDQRARSALNEIDQLRLRYISSLLEQCGVANEECAARSVVAYAYMRVASSLVAADNQKMQDDCERAILG
ncbi:TetR/AcrR family transcriptional regulator [Rhizobium sp. ICMP 5592]|uniref:TetR/AcrR family transcriptional regulator n=1 Tax=Rhizobium sp. ICMP 5592 TaxID=2292445 RepID=UPI0012949FD1|nr:TetR/AcrR family transcriptional regulator [Rhizobium sp. ICMP 5592]MQB46119.1 TetR/AcrR family transcriptional regulator [Rhizobium sp. ICMP 5592]